jgi:Flp pilus assembly pilin Flp
LGRLPFALVARPAPTQGRNSSSIVNEPLGIIAMYRLRQGGILMRSHLQGQPLDDAGATAIEYAMVALFISIAAFSVLVSIGSSVSGVFQTITNSW